MCLTSIWSYEISNSGRQNPDQTAQLSLCSVCEHRRLKHSIPPSRLLGVFKFYQFEINSVSKNERNSSTVRNIFIILTRTSRSCRSIFIYALKSKEFLFYIYTHNYWKKLGFSRNESIIVSNHHESFRKI